MHTKHSQRGVASVETILLVPFLLLLITLIISSSRYASHLIHTSIDARTSAWRSALFDQCPNAVEPRFGGLYLGSVCETDRSYTNRYLSTLPTGSEANLFSGIIRAGGIPEMSSATASSQFDAFLIKDRFTTVITATHSVDAMPAWGLEAMPDGYNRVLPSVE